VIELSENGGLSSFFGLPERDEPQGVEDGRGLD